MKTNGTNILLHNRSQIMQWPGNFRKCQVHDPFIIAFLNGKKIISNEALILSDQNSKTFTNFNISDNIIFKVQVAACRNEMSLEELRKIYIKS